MKNYGHSKYKSKYLNLKKQIGGRLPYYYDKNAKINDNYIFSYEIPEIFVKRDDDELFVQELENLRKIVLSCANEEITETEKLYFLRFYFNVSPVCTHTTSIPTIWAATKLKSDSVWIVAKMFMDKLIYSKRLQHLQKHIDAKIKDLDEDMRIMIREVINLFMTDIERSIDSLCKEFDKMINNKNKQIILELTYFLQEDERKLIQLLKDHPRNDKLTSAFNTNKF
jgi:hypothetical protein